MDCLAQAVRKEVTDASLEQLDVIQRVLRDFCYSSGHQVSQAKTNICFSSNVDLNLCSEISDGYQFTHVEDLGRYLGVPLLLKRVTRGTFAYIVQRVHDRLAGRKLKTLSLAGRVTLAKSVLINIPSYVMQTNRIPKAVCEEIKRLTRNFISGYTDTTKGVNLVCWDQVLHSKYKLKDKLPSQLYRNDCSRNWRGLDVVWPDVRQGIVWTLDSGIKIDFLKDNWVGDTAPLIDHYAAIVAVKPPSPLGGEDQPGWKYYPINANDWDLFFGSLLWSIWIRRNRFIFALDTIVRESVLVMAHKLWMEAQQSASKQSDCREASSLSCCKVQIAHVSLDRNKAADAMAKIA
ncbi:uncharacterized protein LOC120206360 [Hibiscus syriacus]|uniref:uncharacterized protein LOC120206360 n=1 Tax=Hibiscus syriacus TaxID=106335 RepID=UPI001924EEFF|nr:uncharacterized protein LOC120206360 [Hibiscus syriacus]